MSRQRAALWAFWCALGALAYSYLGFPLLTALRALIRPRPLRQDESYRPSVSLIIAAHNEAAVILEKLENTERLDYPPELIEVLVASDGSDDGTPELAAAWGGVRVLALPRQGKNSALNAAAAAARNEILVFTDADSMLEPQALRRLLAPFADPEVGGVAGDFRYAGEGQRGERAYWSFDRALKGWQSRAGSLTSASGQLYAIRRELFRTLPPGVTDDFFISVQAPLAGRRLVFAPDAVATGPQAATARAEFRRKVRVATAGLRGVWMARAALNPWTHGLFALQLLSHKLLRRLAVVPLLVLSGAAPLLWRRGPLFRLTAAGLWGLHCLGLLGFLLRDHKLGRLRLLSLPFYFELVNCAMLAALASLLRGERHDLWAPERPASMASASALGRTSADKRSLETLGR